MGKKKPYAYVAQIRRTFSKDGNIRKTTTEESGSRAAINRGELIDGRDASRSVGSGRVTRAPVFSPEGARAASPEQVTSGDREPRRPKQVHGGLHEFQPIIVRRDERRFVVIGCKGVHPPRRRPFRSGTCDEEGDDVASPLSLEATDGRLGCQRGTGPRRAGSRRRPRVSDAWTSDGTLSAEVLYSYDEILKKKRQKKRRHPLCIKMWLERVVSCVPRRFFQRRRHVGD